MKADFAKYLNSAPFLLISSPANVRYLSGYRGFSVSERECFLLISKDKKYLITDGRYSETLRKTAHDFEIIDTGANRFLSQKSELTKSIGKIGIEEYDLSVSEYKQLNRVIRKMVGVDLSPIREVKTGEEISIIRKACKLTDETFEFILGKLKTGIREKDISEMIELYFLKNGGQSAFPPIVAFGPNSSVPHHASGEDKLKRNSIVLLDFGSKVEGYCSDMTRTVFFGKADAEFKKMHKAVLEAQKTAISKIKIGVKAEDVDKAARNYLIKNNYPNIPHSVGHGTGLLVHESPHISLHSKDKLRTGMVFSVEPGIYVPGVGGVRIEDLVTIVRGKPQLISRAGRNIIEV